MNCPKCKEKLTELNIVSIFVKIEDVEELETTITCPNCKDEGYVFTNCDDIVF